VLRILRAGQLQQECGPLDAVDLRNALYVKDVDGAEFQLMNARGGSAPAGQSRALSATSTGTAEASAETLRLAFNWQNPKHRFLSGLSISLTPLDGASANAALPVASGSVADGKSSYTVPVDAGSVRLIVEVQSPLTTVLRLEQTFKVLRPSGKRPTVVPVGCNVADFPHQHPRVRSLAYTTGTPGTTVIDVPLDLLFLNVTEHVRAVSLRPGVPPGSLWGFDVAERVTLGRDAKSNPTKVRVLEFTGGRPSAWVAVLPKQLQPKPRQGVLLLLKNECIERVDTRGIIRTDQTYVSPDEVNYVRQIVNYWAMPNMQGSYWDPRLAKYNPIDWFGWGKQLEDSRKSVVVLSPIPHNTDFGQIEVPSSKTRSLLDSALCCLTSDCELKTGGGGTAPATDHLIVAAWSSGVNTLLKWVVPCAPQSADLVREFWVFDGKTGLMSADPRLWFKEDPTRRLRLIGTAYTEIDSNRALPLAASNSNVTVLPGDPTYWYTNPDYIRSLAASPFGPYRFRSDPSSPPLPIMEDATAKSGLFLRNETLTFPHPDPAIGTKGARNTFVLWHPDYGERIINDVSHEEAAAFVVYEALKKFTTNAAPVDSQKQFNDVCDWVESHSDRDERKHSHRHRHPWSCMGGQYPGGTFRGYFQICLESSGL
jgi:hypothetical protein